MLKNIYFTFILFYVRRADGFRPTGISCLYLFMLVLLCFCVATEFSVNTDLYIIITVIIKNLQCTLLTDRNRSPIFTRRGIQKAKMSQVCN